LCITINKEGDFIFQSILIEDISNRLVLLRKKEDMTQQEMINKMNHMIDNSKYDKFGVKYVEQSRISYLERGKIKKGYRTFISKAYIDIYEHFFNIKGSHILYGNRENRKKFIEKIYYKIAYNLKVRPEINWNENISYNQELNEIHNLLINLFSANAMFSYTYSKKKMESLTEYQEFNMVILDFSKEEQKVFDYTIEMFKEKICNLLLNSFEQQFVNNDEFKFFNFNNNIIKWFNTRIKSSIAQLEQEMANDEILKIGFQVRQLLQSIYENNSKELLYEILDDENYYPFENNKLKNNDARRSEFIIDLNREYLQLAYKLSKLQSIYIKDISLQKYLNK